MSVARRAKLGGQERPASSCDYLNWRCQQTVHDTVAKQHFTSAFRLVSSVALEMPGAPAAIANGCEALTPQVANKQTKRAAIVRALALTLSVCACFSPQVTSSSPCPNCMRLQVVPAGSVGDTQLAKLEERLSSSSRVPPSQRSALRLKGAQ